MCTLLILNADFGRPTDVNHVRQFEQKIKNCQEEELIKGVGVGLVFLVSFLYFRITKHRRNREPPLNLMILADIDE